MKSPDEGTITGINHSTVDVVVLYAPVALPINNESLLHGKNLTIRCPYTAGMPRETSFVWTKNKDTEQWNGEQLHITHIEKSNAANYTCHVSNSMKPSGDIIVYNGNDIQSFHLDVFYEANVTSFTIDEIANKTVTKNESDPIQFICNADSNPIANMTISHKKTLKITTSNIVKHNISEARCLDAGTYICTAKNMYNEDSIVSKEVQLFVNCYPRTAHEIHSNITSEKNATITITLNVIAYPPPTFIWYKLVDENWTLLHDNDNYDINSSAVQTNLTIRIVGANDFTRYKVKAENDFGQVETNYTLSSYVPAIETSSNSPEALIGGLTGGISGVVIIVIVIILIIRRYPLVKGRGNADQDIRRPDSDDSDDEDGLVDNPMYASSSNVAPVASTSASTSTDIYAKPVKPNKPIVPGKGDLYAVVNKTKKLDKEKNGKTALGNSKQQEADVYENFELDNKPKEKEDDKHSSSGEPASKDPTLKIVNKDGLIYADLLFNGKPPGEKMVIIGDDPTPYSQVDFTKKADPLPESDEEDEK